MTIRSNGIYLSSEVWRWLRLLAKAGSIPEENRILTADEIADQILRQAIREQHPQLAEHEKELDALEKKVIKTLQTPKEP